MVFLTEQSVMNYGRHRQKDSAWKSSFRDTMVEIHDKLEELIAQNVSRSLASGSEDGGSRSRDDMDEAMDVFLSMPVIKRIPKECQCRAAITLTEVIRTVIDIPEDRKA